uniref:Uncharacterized protein n=1 Tax=Arundo donax TaxID=35708 RepID=A0A0A9CTT4_ARUDO
MVFSPSSTVFSILSTRGGSGPQVLSVLMKVEKSRPTLFAALSSSGTIVSGTVLLLVYTTAPPYPSHASFLPR